jgi:hypothetical protein
VAEKADITMPELAGALAAARGEKLTRLRCRAGSFAPAIGSKTYGPPRSQGVISS